MATKGGTTTDQQRESEVMHIVTSHASYFPSSSSSGIFGSSPNETIEENAYDFFQPDNSRYNNNTRTTTSTETSTGPSYRPRAPCYDSDGEEVEEFYRYGQVRDVKPYQMSFLDKKCFEHPVIVTCNASPLEAKEMEKIKRSTIEELNIDKDLKRNFIQLAVNESKLTPIQQYVIPLITNGKQNLHVSYANRNGAKTGLLVGIINEIKKIKQEMEEKKKGPIALFVIKMCDDRGRGHGRDSKKEHLLSKMKQLLNGTSITYALDKTNANVDILVLPVFSFLKAENLDLSNLSYFCVFDGELILKQTEQNRFVNHVLNTINDNVRTILYTNRMTGGQRPAFFEMAKPGSLLIYDPSVHNP